jgi:D-sedoheptulose 7-phosphate isomerase
MNKEDTVVKQIEESMQLRESLQAEAKTVVAISDQLVQALRRGNKVLLFGNGGSAADAQHIACELAGRFSRDREPLPAIALSTNTSSLTAIANDYGYEAVFARQLRGLVKKGDIVIGISTSGNSPNVLLAIEEANRRGAVTIALTGQGGKLKELAHYVVAVPSTSTPRIQEAHITIGHIICHLVEEELFGQGGIPR